MSIFNVECSNLKSTNKDTSSASTNAFNYADMIQKMRDPASLNKLFSFLDDDTTNNSSFEQKDSVSFLGAKSTYMSTGNTRAALKNTLSTNSLFSTFCINIRSLANSNNFDKLSCAINSMKYFPDMIFEDPF